MCIRDRALQTVAPADLSAQVDQLVTAAMRQQQIPAMTVAAAIADRIVYSRAVSYTHLDVYKRQVD